MARLRAGLEYFKFGNECAAPTGLGATWERDPTASAVRYVVSSLSGLECSAVRYATSALRGVACGDPKEGRSRAV
jgi:hypothetical protein